MEEVGKQEESVTLRACCGQTRAYICQLMTPVLPLLSQCGSLSNHADRLAFAVIVSVAREKKRGKWGQSYLIVGEKGRRREIRGIDKRLVRMVVVLQ
jgi:hypothetical protein